MSIEELIQSGFLESYAIGDITDADRRVVDNAIKKHPELAQELRAIEYALETYAFAHAIEPADTEKPMLFAVLDFNNRMKAGESQSTVPALQPGSLITDYSIWLNRAELQEPFSYDIMHGYIIAATEAKTTLIVWLKEGAPDEIHTDEYETFLIVEGTCDIVVGAKRNSLKAGDVFSIPLHINHRVEVTSDIRCKVILERRAA